VGPGNLNPLDELQALSEQVDQVTDLAGLKPIFFRLDELARAHPGDFDIQVSVSELKQRVVTRGTALKQLAQNPDAGQSLRTLTLPPTAPEPSGFPEAAPSTVTMSGMSAPPVPPSLPPPNPPRPNLAPPHLPPPAKPAPASKPAVATRKVGRALAVGVIVGAVLAIALVAILVNRARRRDVAKTVAVQVATTPPGAAIRINGEAKCTANCSVPLVPGDYQVMAFLDGFEPAASTLRVTAGQPAAVNLKLEPQAQTVRILTDLMQGQVALDAEPPADLQDGQFVLNKIQPGMHTVKVASRSGEASFTIEIAEAKAPAVTGPVAVKNLIAVLVSTLGNRARVVTNGSVKLALNGQAQPDGSPAGTDLEGFRPGVNEITVGEGKDQHILAESFGPAPAMTVFLKSDLNIGTLIISAAEDDVRVFLNGKEYPRKTQRGQLRIQTLGSVNVRVTKDGFELPAPQVADVKKGSEVRLEFKLQPLPRVAALQIREATPGAEVVLDQKVLGTVADDGSFTTGAVPPGDHVIELRRENYVPKRLQRQFVAGKAVALAGADGVLAAAVGSVRLTRTPADAAVVYRRADETQTREVRGNQVDLPPGNYIFTARAPGYTERTERVALAVGETHPLDLALAKVVVAAAPPAPKTGGMADFDDPNAWSKQGDLWTHKGGGFIPFKLSANGTYTFTVRLLRGGSLFRGGKIRWALQYKDGKNYDLFELDRKTLTSRVIIAGKTYERGKYEHGLNDREMSYTVQVEVSPDKLVHRLQDGANWLVLDTWSEPGRNFTDGKFAFLIQGSDEIGLSDFKFVPR
jgi:hypothetical protein